jgi:hypothetical protein
MPSISGCHSEKNIGETFRRYAALASLCLAALASSPAIAIAAANIQGSATFVPADFLFRGQVIVPYEESLESVVFIQESPLLVFENGSPPDLILDFAGDPQEESL